MSSSSSQDVPLDPETLLSAYAQGLFPMAGSDDCIAWFTADPRGIFPLDAFHAPQSLRQLMRKDPPVFELRIDHDFAAVMSACMTSHGSGQWINDRLISAYQRLHELGFAHSVETWKDGQLAGGLYGVNLGAVFFGESMFHYVANASKIALVYLVGHLRRHGYELLDCQAVTPHLRRFGCIDIPAKDYMRRLHHALQKHCSFND